MDTFIQWPFASACAQSEKAIFCPGAQQEATISNKTNRIAVKQ